MKFICLGYLEESKFEGMSPEEAKRMISDCFAYDDVLRKGGHMLGGEALASARKAVTLRRIGDKVHATDGPFTETKEVLGGLLLLEARDMNHAVELMSKHPGVKMGPFEIRPADDSINQLYAEYKATSKPRAT
jgi:hypothetical protein